MDDDWPETETSRVIGQAAEAQQKIMKITIRAEHADGSVSELEVAEPDKVGFSRRLPDYGPVWGDEVDMTALLKQRLTAEPTELAVTVRPGLAGWSAAIRPPER